MTEYLVDTSAWHRIDQVVDRWSQLIEAKEVALCTPVTLELLYSARTGNDYASLQEDLRWFPHLALDARVELAALRTQRSLAAQSQHRGPSPTDLLIAATAEIHGVTLLHYDRHFDLIASATGQPTEWLARRGTLD